MKRILVTGGAGFIGSNLCQYLLRRGNYVICLDNFYTGRMENIQDLKNDSNFELMTYDIREGIPNIKVDEIYNLACPASPKWYQKDPIFTFETCILGAMNVLKLAQKNKAKVMQASTSEVYGDPASSPQSETYNGNVNPIGIRSCYDEGKRAAETMFMDYHKMYNIDTRIIRIFNTYGPMMDIDDGRVISNFICQALKNEPITIYGDGSQTRSFQYYSVLIEKMVDIMELDREIHKDIYLPINIGSPSQEFNMSKLAYKIIELTNSDSEVKYEDLPEDDPRQRRPDITRLKKYLDYAEFSVPLEEGLKYTIEYFRRELTKCQKGL